MKRLNGLLSHLRNTPLPAICLYARICGQDYELRFITYYWVICLVFVTPCGTLNGRQCSICPLLPNQIMITGGVNTSAMVRSSVAVIPAGGLMSRPCTHQLLHMPNVAIAITWIHGETRHGIAKGKSLGIRSMSLVTSARYTARLWNGTPEVVW